MKELYKVLDMIGYDDNVEICVKTQDGMKAIYNGSVFDVSLDIIYKALVRSMLFEENTNRYEIVIEYK